MHPIHTPPTSQPYPDPEAAAPSSSRRPVILAVGITIAVMLTVAGAGIAVWRFWPADDPAQPTKAATFPISGALTVDSSDLDFTVGGSCSAESGFDDIDEGTQIVVTDQSGTVIATGSLSPGSLDMNYKCRFTFVVDDVPSGYPFYGVAIGRRGSMQYSRDDLYQSIELTLG